MKDLQVRKLSVIAIFCTGLAVSSFAGGSDDPLYTKLTMDSIEIQNDKSNSFKWDGNIWVGYDINKIYLYSEGSKPNGLSSESENQLVFSHAIKPNIDIQMGVEYDVTPDNNQFWGIVALNGTLPYALDMRSVLLIGEDGNIGLKINAEYEALLTQKLILVPSISTSIYTKDTPEVEIGKGFSNLTMGLKLQYNITKQFSPYVGFEWNKNYGNTYDFTPTDEVYAMAGFKFWF